MSLKSSSAVVAPAKGRRQSCQMQGCHEWLLDYIIMVTMNGLPVCGYHKRVLPEHVVARKVSVKAWFPGKLVNNKLGKLVPDSN